MIYLAWFVQHLIVLEVYIKICTSFETYILIYEKPIYLYENL